MRDQENSVPYEEKTNPADGAAWLWLGIVGIFLALIAQHLEPGTHPPLIASALGIAAFGTAFLAAFASGLRTQLVWWVLSAGSLVGLLVFAALSTS